MRFILRELTGIVVFGVSAVSVLVAADSVTALLRRALAFLTHGL